MTCPIPQGGECTGCGGCSPELFLPAQQPYFDPIQPGADEDPYEQPQGHPH